MHVVGAGRTQAALHGAEAGLALGTVVHLHTNGQRSCLQVTKLARLWPPKPDDVVASQAFFNNVALS